MPQTHSICHTSRRMPPLLIAILLLVGIGFGGLLSCQPSTYKPPESSRTPAPSPTAPIVSSLPRSGEVNNEPSIRVRLQTQAETATLHATTDLRVTRARRDGSPDTASARSFRPPIEITHDGERFFIRDQRGRTLAWRLASLHIHAANDQPMTLGENRYPESLVLVALAGRDGQPNGRFDVINHVPMETYLPGVLERELFGNWELETFKAQAIAARSYALFEQSVNADRHYDIQSTVASQVYGGAATNRRAIDAVRQTRGMAITHNNIIVPGFYSSCCGGLTQTATSAFTRFGNTLAIPPLRGGVTCSHCHASPNYRWNTIHRSLDELAERIAAWGDANDDPVAHLQGLRSIRMSHRSAAGRPARFELIDNRNQRYTLPAEQFRFASNHPHPRNGDLPRDQQLLSSHVRVSLQEQRVRFHDGRGHGHGAGMCQWGAQGMARLGYNANEIITHYYPQARVQRIY